MLPPCLHPKTTPYLSPQAYILENHLSYFSFHLTTIWTCFLSFNSLTWLFLFWDICLPTQLWPQLNSMRYFSWINFNRDLMNPPYLFLTNIWGRFLKLLGGTFNYKHLVHYHYKAESPTESQEFSLSPNSCTFTLLFSPFSKLWLFQCWGQEEGGEGKDKIFFLGWTPLQASLAADAFSMAGIQIMTLL